MKDFKFKSNIKVTHTESDKMYGKLISYKNKQKPYKNISK